MCMTIHGIARKNFKIITTNARYHQMRCLEAWSLGILIAPTSNWMAMMVVHYQKPYLHLAIDVIIGSWGYKFESHLHNDHPWWRHKIGVSKHWVMNSNFLRLPCTFRGVSSLTDVAHAPYIADILTPYQIKVYKICYMKIAILFDSNKSTSFLRPFYEDVMIAFHEL